MRYIVSFVWRVKVPFAHIKKQIAAECAICLQYEIIIITYWNSTSLEVAHVVSEGALSE